MPAGRRVLFRRAAARQFGASDPRFASLFDVGGENSRAAMHVDAYDNVLSDAGSTPAASTISKLLSTHSLSYRRSTACVIRVVPLHSTCAYGVAATPCPHASRRYRR